MPGGQCCPHWISPPASPRCGGGWSAQQGFEGQWAPTVPLVKRALSGFPFGQASVFFFNNSTNGIYWLEGEMEKEGIWALAPGQLHGLGRPPAGQAFPVGWFVCAHWWFQVSGPPVAHMGNKITHIIVPLTRPPYSSQCSGPCPVVYWIVSSCSAVFRGRRDGGSMLAGSGRTIWDFANGNENEPFEFHGCQALLGAGKWWPFCNNYWLSEWVKAVSILQCQCPIGRASPAPWVLPHRFSGPLGCVFQKKNRAL